MAKHIRRFGPAALVIATLVAIVLVIAPPHESASSATYVDPFWSNTSSSPECAACGCGCPGPSEWSPEGVSYRTGELSLDFYLFSTPGVLESNVFSLRWRSEIDGATQMGRGMLGSWEHSVEKVILNEFNPEGSGGHEVYWRRPDGLVVLFTWDGSEYSSADCAIHHTLTHDSPYTLTDLQGNEMRFDETSGLVDQVTDRNGNVTSYSYSGNQLTGITDNRGKSYTVTHDANGFVDSFSDPAGREWEFTYDGNGNLTEVLTPTTPDQTSGITTTISYDGSDRITAIEDGRGNTVNTYTWVSSTRQIDKVTIAGDDVDYGYTSGLTTVTDRLGNIRRYHYSGRNITQTDMWIGSTATYVTTYAYSGAVVVTIVYPRTNRVDFTYNGSDELTERRHKLANTTSSSGTDLVHTWTWSSHFVSSYTNPEGDETSYTRDGNGNVTAITYPTVTSPSSQTASKSFSYNSLGQLATITDEESRLTQFTYFGAGDDYALIQKVEVDPSGLDLETVYEYDAAWNVSGITSPNGHETEFEYDNLRRLVSRTAPSPLSYEVTFTYDGNGNVVTQSVDHIDEDGDAYANGVITTSYTYTTKDQVATIVEEIGDGSSTRTTSFDYDDEGQRIRVTKPEGNKEKWTYDARGLVSSHIRGETATEETTTEFAYDTNGNLVTVTNGRDYDTDHTYDLFDRRTVTTNALDHYAEWAYDKSGRVTEETRRNASDTLLARRSLYYDERGRLWKVSDLRDDPTASTYSDAVTEILRYKTGHVSVVTDPRDEDLTYTYDAAWRRTGVVDAAGNETTWVLDDNGNAIEWAIEETDGTSTVTHEYEATYDALNRRVTLLEIDRLDSQNILTTTYGHDSRSNLVWMENAKGDPTRFTFDAAGRMTKKEVALTTGTSIEDFTTAIVTTWGFDKNDRLTSHKDDATNETTWDFDALDRVETMTYPDTSEVSYLYDDADNVTSTTDAAGNLIVDTYDAVNQLTARAVTRATGFLDTTSETFTYDGMGRMLTASDNDYQVEFTYAVIGLRSFPYEEKQSYVGGTAHLKTVTKSHDAAGNKLQEQYPSGTILDYTWSPINLLTAVDHNADTIAAYEYMGTRVTGIDFQNGTSATYTYTGFRGEVSRIHHTTSSPTTIVDLNYGYDSNHDRLYERFGASGPGDAFEYDKARRLTLAWIESDDPTAPSGEEYVKKIQYNYDDDGNRSSVVVTPYGESAVTTSYTDNSLNQYTAVGAASPDHDDNGNLVDDGTLTFEYNYKNLICRVKEGETTVATYRYDALGRRVEKNVDSDVERYVYSGHETVAVYDGADTWIRDFFYGSIIDEILAMDQADVLDADDDENMSEVTRSFYHLNALGSVMEITEIDEDVAVSYRYDPYGAVTITRNSTPQGSDPLGNPWMFTGRMTDEETGLYYYRARYYSPETGRFLQRDPLGVGAGASLYEYAGSAPTELIDPLGLLAADPPDLQTRASVPPEEPPQSRLPDAFVFMGYMDQWIESEWLEGLQGATWLLRYRDNIETTRMRRRTGNWKITRDVTPTHIIYKLYIEVEFIEFRTNADRGELRNRELYVFEEFLRGPRRHFSRWKEWVLVGSRWVPRPPAWRDPLDDPPDVEDFDSGHDPDLEGPWRVGCWLSPDSRGLLANRHVANRRGR